jgi:hypothetical protein
VKRLLRKINRIFDSSETPMLALWNWAKEPRTRYKRHRRWKALEEWASRRRKAAPAGSAKRRHWLQVQEEYARRVFATRRREDETDDLDWPANGTFSEFLYHSPGPHVHIASPDREFLIQVCRIGQAKYGLRIGEFPPFDPVEPVHVSGSWHYRDSSSPWTPRDFGNRGDGLAADINDADGGSDQEVAFYNELARRYR